MDSINPAGAVISLIGIAVVLFDVFEVILLPRRIAAGFGWSGCSFEQPGAYGQTSLRFSRGNGRETTLSFTARSR